MNYITVKTKMKSQSSKHSKPSKEPVSEYLASLYENAYSHKDDKSLKLPSLNSDVVSKVSEDNRKYVTVIDQSAN